jgi:hypothetical protein
VRGKGSKLGEPCPKVRLSQDRLPIEQAYFAQMSLWQMSLGTNVTQPKGYMVTLKTNRQFTKLFSKDNSTYLYCIEKLLWSLCTSMWNRVVAFE